MRPVRPFTRDDIPAIVALRTRTFPRESRSAAELSAMFETVFLGNPWRDDALPPLVYVNGAGRPIGFLGVVPRPVTFHGEPLRMAVTSQFMAEPEAGGAPAVALLKVFFAGAQDLAFADFSSDVSRRVWEAVGGSTIPFASLAWVQPLRPARYQMGTLQRRLGVRGLSLVLRPLSALIDRFVAAPSAPRRLHAEPLTPRTLACEAAPLMAAAALAPVYDERSAQWLLARMTAKCGRRKRGGAALRDADHGLAGWYLWREMRGRLGQVIQFVARPGYYEDVLRALLFDTWSQGMIAATGRADPAMLASRNGRDPTFTRRKTWVIAHARRPELLAAIQAGDSALSLLDGEWWMGF